MKAGKRRLCKARCGFVFSLFGYYAIVRYEKIILLRIYAISPPFAQVRQTDGLLRLKKWPFAL